MGYGGSSNFPSSNDYVLGIYVPTSCCCDGSDDGDDSSSGCPADCVNCLDGGGGTGCYDRCAGCSDECLTCVEYGGGAGCDERCV